MPAPAAHLCWVVRAVEGSQHRLFIERDEGRVRQLGARLRPGARRDSAGRLAGRQPCEELRQAALEALNPFLQHQQDHARKGELPAAGEGVGLGAVPGQELRAAQPLAHGLEEPQRAF
jgi:hypothetical protein